jgi:predicted ATPase
MNTNTSPILTPDQRLRVFVSSTLQELAEERSAVKNAIQHMHLTPVMFELGARPHAPRNLYREYLSQSHIFVGIYWDSYGWVAPDEKISGLEDEYNLSGDLPKLIYIKESEEKREDRLAELLKRIEQDDKVSYKKFTSSNELANLIINDLALLLTERFNLTLHQKITETESKTFHSIPSFPNRLIGREEAIEEITTIMSDPANRLITLTGAGGIGKTRLAIEAARLLQETYPNGAVFVPLAPVRDHELVDETICYALGIKVSGGNMLDSLKLFLQDKKFLLVLDNFEQIIEAASIIDDLLIASPGLKIIVTSRERLALSFEQVYTVPALANVCPEQLKDDEKYPAAFELFVQRAKAIQPSFEVTPQNREIICKICRRVEGLPLAIELAAGQVNLFSPSILLQKLEKSLCVLKGNFRDTPDRQKTIHNTVEWSFDLLCVAEQNLLLQVSLYPAGCLLSAVESMEIEAGYEVYALLGSLVDKSLLIKQEEASEVRFQMLESVREFSKEKLKDPVLLEHLMQQQAEYYHRALQGIKLPKDDINQTQLLKYLETEQPNIRQVLDFLMQKKDIMKVADIAWNLWLFWWVNAHTKEGYTWLKKAWEFNKENPSQLDQYTFAILACNVGIMSVFAA